MSCVFDPDSLLQEEVEDTDTKRGGTLAPLITIVVLMLFTLTGIIAKNQIKQKLEKITKKKPRKERERSMSELEVMELDPFSSESRNIKTFSVRSEIEDFHHNFDL